MQIGNTDIRKMIADLDAKPKASHSTSNGTKRPPAALQSGGDIDRSRPDNPEAADHQAERPRHHDGKFEAAAKGRQAIGERRRQLAGATQLPKSSHDADG